MIALFLSLCAMVWILRKLALLLADAKRRSQTETARLDRIERKQEEHEERLDNHDESIRKVLEKMEQLEADIDHLDERLSNLYAKRDWILLQQEGTTTGGAEWLKYQDKILTVDNQIHAAETKRRKAINAKRDFYSKLEVA